MARLFGDRSGGPVAVVEASVSRSYARNARVTFYVVAVGFSAVVSAVLATLTYPARAIVLGLAVGAVWGLAVAAIVRAWPMLRVLWHWSAEIAVTGGLVAALVWAASIVGWLGSLSAVLAVVLILGVVGSARRCLVAWVWCAIVRHRLRVCFAEFVRAANKLHPDRLPLLLLVRPTPAGERVWLWLRPGLDLSDLDERADKLAVACWASEVRVVRASARFAALLRVDVARRDPLTGLVASPLAPLARSAGESVPPPARDSLALDLPDVPEELPEPPQMAGRR